MEDVEKILAEAPKEYRDLVGCRVRLRVPQETFCEKDYDNLYFNTNMIKALNKDPYVYVEKIVITSISKRTYRLRARFSDGDIWSIIPKWIDTDGPVLFLE